MYRSTIVASFIRAIIYLQSTAVEFGNITDHDILISGGMYWSLIECGVGLISCCLPSTYGVLRRSILRRDHASHRNARQGHSNSSEGYKASRSILRGIQHHRIDSQASEIELAAVNPAHTRLTTKVEGPTENTEAALAIHSRNRIGITKTFAVV